MASIRIWPPSRSSGSSRKRCMGTARTMRSAKPTTSSVETARAPGASTSTISAMRSAAPDPEIATSYPAAIAARAIVVPTLPAPTIPRRRSPVSPLDTGLSRHPRGDGARWNGGNGMIGEQFAHPRDQLAPGELDCRQPLFVRHSSSGVRQVKSTEPEQPHHRGNLGGDRFWRSDIQRSACSFGLESGHRRACPSALARRLLERLLPVGVLNIDGLLICPRNVSVRMHSNRQWRGAVRLERALVDLDQRSEAAGRSADDGEHQGKAVAGGPHHRLRAATDTNPGGKVSFRERRSHVLVYERRSQLAGPGHRWVREQPRKQVELLLEELLVVGEVEAEQWEGLGQRAATDDELCTAVRHGVERREGGVDPHRVLRAQHGDGSAEPNAFGSAGDGRQHDVRRRVHEIRPVMLADVERIDPDRVGKDSLLDIVADHGIRREGLTGFIDGDVAERVQSELEFRGGHCSGHYRRSAEANLLMCSRYACRSRMLPWTDAARSRRSYRSGRGG